jgi:hypothetical protein
MRKQPIKTGFFVVNAFRDRQRFATPNLIAASFYFGKPLFGERKNNEN